MVLNIDQAHLRVLLPWELFLRLFSLITLVPQGLQGWGSPHCPPRTILPACSIKTPAVTVMADCATLPALLPQYPRIHCPYSLRWRSLGGTDSKESACSVGDTGDMGSVPGSGRSPGQGSGNPLQYCCLENPMDRGLVGCRPWSRTESDTSE